MTMRLLKMALLASAIVVALVGTACAVDLLDPDVVCTWYFMNGQWVRFCW